MSASCSSPTRTRTWNKPVNGQRDAGRKALPCDTPDEEPDPLSAPLALPPLGPELACVLNAWPSLPRPIRAAVIALAGTAQV